MIIKIKDNKKKDYNISFLKYRSKNVTLLILLKQRKKNGETLDLE